MPNYTTNPVVKKKPVPAWEHDPFVYAGNLYRAGFRRSWTGWSNTAVIVERYNATEDSWSRLGEVAWPYAMGSVLVENGTIYVFGTTNTASPGNSIKRRTLDLANLAWTGAEVNVYTAPAGVKIYNTSVTKGSDKYIIAYETDEATAFSLRFLQSTNLVNWSPIGALGHSTFYSACSSINYAENGYYIVTYMWNNSGTYETAIARTNDFVTMQNFSGNSKYTAYQQLMSPDAGEGNNNSDFAMCEFDGRVYMTYLTGDQSTWAWANDAWYDGTLIEFYREWWP